MKALKLLCFFCVLGGLNPAYGQTLTFFSAENKKSPIEGVSISNKQKTLVAESDKKGRVDISTFLDQDSLYISHPVYAQKVVHSQELQKPYQVYLKPLYLELENFVLHSKRNDLLAPRKQGIKSEEISRLQSQNTADLLEKTSFVQVQKTQSGGGSPVIRGFEANKVLLVLDGVRLNNAIYKSGHQHSIAGLGPHMLEEVEVFYGPGSVSYGSDALGGVLQFHSKKALLKKERDSSFKAFSLTSHYGSANQEKSLHLDRVYGNNKWAFLSALSLNDYGDVRMGTFSPHGYTDWGKQFEYVRLEPEGDLIANNPDPSVQKNTAYSQAHFMQKIRFEPRDSLEFLINAFYNTSSDIHRYDKYQETSAGSLKFAEWYYGPQQHLFLSTQLRTRSKSRYFDQAILSLTYQKIDEDRYNRKFSASNKTKREEDLKVISLNTDLRKKTAPGKTLFYGMEWSGNILNSQAREISINTGEESAGSTRYPDGGSFYASGALYAMYQIELKRGNSVSGGLRFNHTMANSHFEDSSFFALPFDQIQFENSAISGSLTWEQKIRGNTILKTALSTGYRNPNIDDYGKFREKGGQVLVPTNLLKPEYLYSAEMNLRGNWASRLSWDAGLYFNVIENIIVQKQSDLNGLEYILYDGDSARVVVNSNSDRGLIYGYYGAIKLDLEPWQFTASVNQSIGTDLSRNAPLAHIPPLSAKTSLKYERKKWISEVSLLFKAWKKLEDYSGNSADNLPFATPEGSPSWYKLDIRTSYSFNPSLSLQVAVENLMDYQYRSFASAISAPGRNYLLTFRVNF